MRYPKSPKRLGRQDYRIIACDPEGYMSAGLNGPGEILLTLQKLSFEFLHDDHVLYL